MCRWLTCVGCDLRCEWNDSNVQNQSPSLAVCGSGCCGCNAVWAVGCSSNVSVCQPCTGVAPFEVNTTCINGAWVVPNSYTGGLTVNGQVLINGDYILPPTNLLVFYGWNSALNVTGKATIQESVTIAVPDDQVSTLSNLGSYNKQTASYMNTGSVSSTSGSAINVVANTRQQCQIPRIYATGTASHYGASITNYNTCNTWWILVVSIVPPIAVGLLAGILPALCR